ncbi:ROK family protein [Acidiferrobacter thiooxydans]|uniref:ROK family protein n=1 Tax=Acidiferrobacter thiooxydans TaxID=163359 RepID=UPI001C4001AC|nr:ROK family protein [Acidiferrobacter thiooxydans]UEN99181.1 ROK family protein [Acidiferrobacter thiooxydans]
MRIGIDLGGTKIEGIAMDASGRELARRRIATPAVQGYDAILEAIAALVRDLEGVTEGPCTVGVGSPGAISHKTGVLKNSNTICLNGRPLREDLARRLDRPVRLENDANCLALSEARDGAGQGRRCVFAVILGTGVGGGLVLDGALWPGRQHIAGEWGHNVLETDGPACYCGRRGCVETLLSGPGLAASYRALGGQDGATAQEIASRAACDVRAQAALDLYCARLGRALGVVVNILDPDVIVLGGGLSAIPALYTEVPTLLAQAAFTDDLTTPIVPAQHGAASGVRGAAHLWPPSPLEPRKGAAP